MINDTLHHTEEKMKAAVEALKKELATIRTGHASPALVEHIKVDYAGVPTPLNQLAGISASAARLLVIQPWDRSSLRSIEKAILTSDLGLNPTNDGNIIRINIPPLSEERRQELAKAVRNRVEKDKIIVRNLRRDAIDKLRKAEKSKEISEDQYTRSTDQFQKLIDGYTEKVNQIGNDKETEIMEV